MNITSSLQQFKTYFQEMELNNLSVLDDFYDERILFKDPIHELQGLAELKKYYQNLNKNLKQGSFSFRKEAIVEDTAYLEWTMKLKLKRPSKHISVDGITLLTINKKIVSQRDYFDAGALIYEHIPVLGYFIRSVKRKMM